MTWRIKLINSSKKIFFAFSMGLINWGLSIFTRRCSLLGMRQFTTGSSTATKWELIDLSLLGSIRTLLNTNSKLPILDRDLIDPVFLQEMGRESVEFNASQSQLDLTLSDAGILLDDIFILSEFELGKHNTLGELRNFLYGTSSVSILVHDLAVRVSQLDPQGTALRRQLLIERLASLQAVIEYRLFAQSMIQRGMLGTVSDMRQVWSDWLNSVSLRIDNVIKEKRRGSILLKNLNIPSDKIAAILCVTAVSEIASPPKIPHRDEDVLFNSEVRKWTNTDLSESLSSPPGRVSFLHLADSIGSVLLFQSSGNIWAPDDKITLGSELVAVLLSECYIHVPSGDHLLQTSSPTVSVDLAEELRTTVTRDHFVPASVRPDPTVLVHAFQHIIETRGFKSVGFVSLRPELVERLKSVVPSTTFMKLSPMVVPPARWAGFWRCGYVTRRSPLIRFTGTKDPARDAAFTDLSNVRRAMDYLGSTKWRVSTDILALVELALKSLKTIPGIPPKDIAEEKVHEDDRPSLLRRLREKRKLESLEPILMSKLNPARDFQNSDLYFPHSVDFRGRAYPIAAPFNHQGDDICRALLRFGEAKPLGQAGWYWLRIHLANLFGQDKQTLSDRISWVHRNSQAIQSVAEDPLGQSEWVAARTDDFWQAVAASIEYRLALINTTGPSNFNSSLPVHQDGSCNGLQHYAALGKDHLGGLAVNIVPSSRVEDVYTVVLNIVKKKIQNDAKGEVGDDEISKRCLTKFSSNTKSVLAQVAMHYNVLQRKTVKQTVMTICYGVTHIGASDQICNQLKELPIAKVLSPTQLAVMGSYLAKLTLASIDEVFADAMGIKRWFDKVAKEINTHKLAINWITPAGLPCRQPYRKIKVLEIKTPVQKLKIIDTSNSDRAPVSASKQRMGFPPNFVHSLDASHMILTALECEKAGITFAAVHDSFWTHACDVPVMNEAIRKQFVQMYSKPILEQLRESLVIQLGADGNKIPPLPKQGDLDLNCVLDSPYFFD